MALVRAQGIIASTQDTFDEACKWAKHWVEDREKAGKPTCLYDLPAPERDTLWSGSLPVPSVGDRVVVPVNSAGPGVVLGYFVEHGWLGVTVQLDAPAKWRPATEQRKPIHVFGTEVRSAQAAARMYQGTALDNQRPVGVSATGETEH